MSGILTLNAGSSSIKFGVYSEAAEPDLLMVGQIDNLGPVAKLVVKGGETRDLGHADHASGVRAILDVVEPVLNGAPAGVGHRIVHGGKSYGAPVVLDDTAIAQLDAFVPLAPLHQPHNLAAVRAAQAAFPDAVQVGCFDTAFHKGHPFVNDTFALPRRFYDEGVRRYGFHGLSYDYIHSVLERDYPELHAGRVIVAHLGNGASMCAMHGGRSVGSTMGFSALDGLPMGTRCGQLDPGVLLYMLEQKGMSVAEISKILYSESGLKGMSELTNDMRVLLESDDPKAAEAIDYYVFRIRREIGALAAVLCGLDGIVFCGGVGENAAPIRARVVEGLEFLGLGIDAEANAGRGKDNASGAMDIGTGTAKVLVIPTDEERVIARSVAAELNAA